MSRPVRIGRPDRADGTGHEHHNHVAGASAFQQSQTADQVGTAVAVKSLDAERHAGAGVLKMLAAAVTGVGRSWTWSGEWVPV